jgi:hypothetical protein
MQSKINIPVSPSLLITKDGSSLTHIDAIKELPDILVFDMAFL